MSPPEKIQPEKLNLFFQDVCAEEKSIFDELVDDTLNAVEEVRRGLARDLTVEKLPEITRQVHSLKSILRTFGGEVAARQALHLERALREDPARLPDDYPTLREDFLQTLDEFEEALNTLRHQIGTEQTATI